MSVETDMVLLYWQDENGVYCQCAACMVKKPGG